MKAAGSLAAAAPHQRYVHKPFFGSSHWWAGNCIAALPRTGKVLDIGPGSGAIGRLLREQGFKEIYAVEPDEATRSTVAGIYTAISGTIDPFRSARFGLILLLDVLEHMADPESFFDLMVDLLEPGGTVLVSVPNIAHWSVRLPLLCGRFEYTSRGILDRTHLQFFTVNRVKQLMSRAALDFEEMNASISPAELVLPPALYENPIFTVGSKLRHLAARALPGLCAYQILARAVRREAA